MRETSDTPTPVRWGANIRHSMMGKRRATECRDLLLAAVRGPLPKVESPVVCPPSLVPSVTPSESDEALHKLGIGIIIGFGRS